ncbi:MAG: RNase adapter RapZ [Acidobacteria bacterium]|nr:RNase adapter RapZ [Acidobacteriota bacterium]
MTLKNLAIITGLSGSGKHTVSKAFEDIGYFCVDNIPIPLIPRLIQLSEATEGKIDRLALVVDARLGEAIHDLQSLVHDLRRGPARTVLVFVEASEEALARRFSETRRLHPLASDRNVLDGIREEQQKLREIRGLADIVLNTSDYTVHELRKFIEENFRESPRRGSLVVTVMSFGYKNGVPFNADLVFDVRFLPNPHFEPELKDKTGLDPEVERYMQQFPDTQVMLGKIYDLLQYLIPKYTAEGKSYLTIALGCTGGRHRSVVIANALRQLLDKAGLKVNAIHRDIHTAEGLGGKEPES